MSASAFIQTRHGRAVDLLDPKVEDIDFEEIAETLANIPRYTGSSEKPVSVGKHLLIGADAVGIDDRAHWLLHDAHEYVLGDVGVQQQKAHSVIAEALYGSTLVAQAWHALCSHWDRVIWRAAGIARPDAEQQDRIHRADIIALRTEIRDFNGDRMHPRAWSDEIRATLPLNRVYRWQPPDQVAADLYSQFRTYLPSLAT